EVLKLFCFCREAERSIHRALSDPWHDFLAYYTAARRMDITQTVEAANQLLGRFPACSQPPSPTEIHKRPSGSYMVRNCLGRWLARWQTSWAFAAAEVCFFAVTLSALLRLLNEPQKPENDRLIELRMAFCDCEWIIESHCCGLPELDLAR